MLLDVDCIIANLSPASFAERVQRKRARREGLVIARGSGFAIKPSVSRRGNLQITTADLLEKAACCLASVNDIALSNDCFQKQIF